jgi:hypothetical protein
VFAPLLSDETAVFQAHEVRTFLETLVQTLFDYLLEHPRVVRVLTWEMAEGWHVYAQVASQFPRETTDQFETFFQKARNAGLLRSDFAPVFQLAMVTQLCLTYLVSFPLYQSLQARIFPPRAPSHTRASVSWLSSLLA